MGPARALLPLLVLPALLAVACGSGTTPPDPTPAPTPPTARAAPTATPTPTATPAPAWWEEDQETATPHADLVSRVWNVRVEPVSDGAVSVTFDYHLELAPEANVFVHIGLLPDVLVALLDADGVALGTAGGALDPTEFGDDAVGGEATFPIATTGFDDVVAVHVCIRVVTGNAQSFAGRTEVFCEDVPAKKVEE
ncbi:MAG: hypothetical protein OXG61_02680 [Chloroflexi bacterium]|nr:hypothetical protein [Chloroflexota bacterium]